MNEELVKDLKLTISELKKEIILKQNKLDELIREYQELNGIIPEEPIDSDEE